MTTSLTPLQYSALLDILTHYETYAEIRQFRKPNALDAYGPPFSSKKGTVSSTPALQALLSRFVLNLPGLKEVPNEFWTVQVQQLIQNLEESNLSESYDKGSVGSRKTLATAISALIEYPVRGTYGGFAEVDDHNDKYDLHSAEDLTRGFRNFVDQCIYESVLDDLVNKAAETDRLEDHSNSTKAVHEFVLVNLASFMHYTLILSPKGQYLLKLIDNAHKLIPYMAIRQALKIGNIATMISALMKIILAKMSVASLTNWIGLTDTRDDGMNLLQQIISTVLNWDVKELETRVIKIEKDKAAPSKDILQALNDYTSFDMAKQTEIRQHSQNSDNSIVITILADAGKPSDLQEDSHRLALEYLSCKLSVRDRAEIVKVACHSHPDHVTALVRTVVNAYEPVIRHMHNAVDLADTVTDFQNFLNDMLKVARIPPPGKDGHTVIPSVGDFIQLLRKHQYSSHKFIHQLCKNGKEVTQWYLDWAKAAAAQFQRSSTFEDANESQGADNTVQNATDDSTARDAGDLTEPLGRLFKDLPDDTKSKIVTVLDQTILYIDEMHSSSKNRLADVIKSAPTQSTANSSFQKLLSLSRPGSRAGSRASSPARGNNTKDTPAPASASHGDNSQAPTVSSNPGPGAYLARWQDLLDSTPITPLTIHGKPARATDKAVVEASATDVDGGKTVNLASQNNVLDAQKVQPNVQGGGTKSKKDTVKKPDVKLVIDALGDDFRELLAQESLAW